MNNTETQQFSDLNELASYIYSEVNQKWWRDEAGNPIQRNPGELLMLVITELAEAVEGIRKNLMDDHLPHHSMEVVEMADAKIRLLDYAAGFGIKIGRPLGLAVFGDNKAENILLICKTVGYVHDAMTGEKFGAYQPVYINRAVAQIDAYCARYHLPLNVAMAEKIAYNKTRADHTHEARKLANGKKF